MWLRRAIAIYGEYCDALDDIFGYRAWFKRWRSRITDLARAAWNGYHEHRYDGILAAISIVALLLTIASPVVIWGAGEVRAELRYQERLASWNALSEEKGTAVMECGGYGERRRRGEKQCSDEDGWPVTCPEKSDRHARCVNRTLTEEGWTAGDFAVYSAGLPIPSF